MKGGMNWKFGIELFTYFSRKTKTKNKCRCVYDLLIEIKRCDQRSNIREGVSGFDLFILFENSISKDKRGQNVIGAFLHIYHDALQTDENTEAEKLEFVL